jgi:hypothetical protein
MVAAVAGVTDQAAFELTSMDELSPKKAFAVIAMFVPTTTEVLAASSTRLIRVGDGAVVSRGGVVSGTWVVSGP